MSLHEAAYYTKLSQDNNKVRCDLCPHNCLLTDGKAGVCRVRKNIGGKLYALTYCRPVSAALDPIEKKPLYHFYPGSQIFSLGPSGCTFKCDFCQNSDLSQQFVDARELAPAAIAQESMKEGSIGIAYTYSEPYTWFETILSVGTLVRDAGGKNVMVTNGYMEQEPLAELLDIVDAMNIDIKSMNPQFYKTRCKADLLPVLRSCEQAKKKCHVEITNLLIPDVNDSDEEIRKLAAFISTNLGKDTPLHLSRYFPRYKMTTTATPVASLVRAKQIADTMLDFVYVGNVNIGHGSDTMCPKCKHVLIERKGNSVKMNESLITDAAFGRGRCGSCSCETNIVMRIIDKKI